jgi:hypothetical protein
MTTSKGRFNSPEDFRKYPAVASIVKRVDAAYLAIDGLAMKDCVLYLGRAQKFAAYQYCIDTRLIGISAVTDVAEKYRGIFGFDVVFVDREHYIHLAPKAGVIE